MSEEKKESKVESKPSEDSQLKQSSTDSKIIDTVSGASSEAEIAARAAEDAETAVREAMAKAKIAKEKAEAAAEVEYKAIAAQVKADTAKAPDYTFKRKGEQIFRREMGEPEFFLDKKDRFPRPILTADEQESLTRKAEKPRDQTPAYVPEHVLSPEFEGISNYEQGVSSFLEEIKQKLEKLKNSSDSSAKEIRNTENEIKYLESIHENFYIGMNVFRTAKGGRDKIKA
jgi:colicin import membrane protein|tara:strand:+ start:355 stop:1041 length:687 start_codon:yes stop_codon:yes gene_type:complete